MKKIVRIFKNIKNSDILTEKENNKQIEKYEYYINDMIACLQSLIDAIEKLCINKTNDIRIQTPENFVECLGAIKGYIIANEQRNKIDKIKKLEIDTTLGQVLEQYKKLGY